MNLKPHYPLAVGDVPRAHLRVVYDYIEANIERVPLSLELPKIRKYFCEANPPCLDEKYFNVAVHVRRPNPHDDRVDGTDTPDEYYLRLINKIRAEHEGVKPLRFYLVSQGKLADFKNYLHADTILMIDTPALGAFRTLVEADVLIISRSSFSYIAGHLNENLVYYQPFWHPPLPHWRVPSPNDRKN